MTAQYTIPSHVLEFLQDEGYQDASTDMLPYIDEWNMMFRAEGDFWTWDEIVNGVHRKGHRMTIKPAKKVAKEWASLLMNEDTVVNAEAQDCTDYLADYFRETQFFAKGQGLVCRSFALGTGAWALWVDTEAGKMTVNRYDARMIIPLSWDEGGVTECAFASKVVVGGKQLDQLQLHVIADDGNYHIVTKLWDEEGQELTLEVDDEAEGFISDFDTMGDVPWFAIVRPAGENTFVDFSPYGASVYADAEDALRGVDLCYDAMMNEVDLAKMRIFIGDMLIEYNATDADGNVSTYKNAIPFGRDNTVFRKVMSTESLIQEYAPAMRTESQREAYRTALQLMGDACGFGESYFDINEHGGIRTATEVASDNSKLMRHISEHGHLLSGAVAAVSKALLHCARTFLGVPLSEEGVIEVSFDDSIIQDTAAEKMQDLAEVGVTMNDWEYRMKWYGEDEETAKENAPSSSQVEVEEPLFEEEPAFAEEPEEPEGEPEDEEDEE